jgi:UDP-N-acetylmuramoyl-L-alanyl-D-glutamate--2,6-diaminopimelate ligase
MNLNELVAGFAQTVADVAVAHITADSRQVIENTVFFALAGATVHGLKYAQTVLEAGAVAIIYDPAKDGKALAAALNTTIPVIEVLDLKEKLADFAARFYHYPARDLNIIGITGTNGKTSCSQFLAQVLRDSLIIGTLGWGTWGKLKATGYTTPDGLVLQQIFAHALAVGQKNVVMEVSSHGLQEGRLAQTAFKGAVFTNLSRDHLDYHGSMDDYFNAKLQLFQRPELEFVVINQDDSYAERIMAALNPTVALWTFSKNLPGFKNLEGLNSHNVQAENIHCSIDGIQFDVQCAGQTAQVNSRLYGEFNVENLLAVLTTLLALGADLHEAAEKLSTLKSVPGRMEHFGGDTHPVVFVDYAHTPDALEKVLRGVKKHNPQRLFVVFGCGGNRDAGKRPLMGKIASEMADTVIITDDNPRYEDNQLIINEILAGCGNKPVTVIADRAQAIQTAIAQATAADCVVIAGKGHEDYQEIQGVKTPFSDQAMVKQALAVK